MGKHIDEVHRLKAIEEGVLKKIGILERKGWCISAASFQGFGNLDAFLDKLIADGRSFTGENVKIFITQTFGVSASGISIDHQASIDQIIAYLNE